ncbi:MAG: hypothetical protein ACKO9Q_08400, partial [Pirellula sp.]
MDGERLLRATGCKRQAPILGYERAIADMACGNWSDCDHVNCSDWIPNRILKYPNYSTNAAGSDVDRN